MLSAQKGGKALRRIGLVLGSCNINPFVMIYCPMNLRLKHLHLRLARLERELGPGNLGGGQAHKIKSHEIRILLTLNLDLKTPFSLYIQQQEIIFSLPFPHRQSSNKHV